MMIRGSIEEQDRLLIEGYLSHKWGLALPSDHPWSHQQPTFGEIVSEGSTPIGITSQSLAPIVVNRNPANQTDTSASLTGQLINAGMGLIEETNFTPFDYSGLRLWLDASDADGDGSEGSGYQDGNAVEIMVDKSGQGNDATQGISDSRPLYSSEGLNGKPVLQFDGIDDYLAFNEINSIRTVVMVVKRNTGNQGFLLGHETSYAFHSGSGSAWSEIWTDPYLLNGILQVNGSMLDGLNQNYSYDSTNILSIQTTGMLPASSFSKDRDNSVHWNGDLAELIIYNEPLPISTIRKLEGYLAHKWGISEYLVGSHPYKSFPPVRSKPAALTKIYWGGADGGEDPTLWENVEDVGEVSVGLRKLSGSVSLVATPPPNQAIIQKNQKKKKKE
jgi:hypothetical protein